MVLILEFGLEDFVVLGSRSLSSAGVNGLRLLGFWV
jgi:hypothetical protein